MGARNLKDEKKRIVRELKADGGYITKKKKPSWITKKETKPKYLTKKKITPRLIMTNNTTKTIINESIN